MQQILDLVFKHWADSVMPLVGAIIGAIVAGLFVLWGQNRADKQQRKRESRSEEQTITGVLQSLHSEIEVFSGTVLGSIRATMDPQSNPSTPPPKPVKLLPISQGYFAIFDANASVLGRLRDTHLTEQIVRFYACSKYLVDQINHYQTEFDLLARLRHEANAEREVSDLQQEIGLSFMGIWTTTQILVSAANTLLPKIKTRLQISL
jgi:hypothetical protein